MGRQETQLRAASCLVEEDCVQGLKTYVSPFRTEMGFGPISEFAPYPIPLPHLTSVPLLSQHVDPASEEHDAGKTQGILKIKFLGFSFFLSFFEVREIYPAIWYIFVNNGAPVQHEKLCKNNSCDRPKVGYRKITIAN